MRLLLVLFTLSISVFAQEPRSVGTLPELLAAIADGKPGDRIQLAAGRYELRESLCPKSGMKLIGAGPGKTVLSHAPSWVPAVDSLPDPEMKTMGLDESAYLIRLPNKGQDIELAQMTLRGPKVHGAVFGFGNERLHIHHVHIEDVLWSGIRTFGMRHAKIHDCVFVDAGGRWKRGGKPGVDGGITGGGIFAIWMKDSEVAHNRFTRTQSGKENSYFGIKVRQAKRSRFHHNTIEVNFSMEFPFENDEDVEIDHNICHGTVSLPKHAGGPAPESGRTFRLHHNLFHSSYAIEFVRNGIEIDHNLFLFDPAKDVGNLISGFGRAAANGPASFHHNLVKNPGRGVVWINEPYGAFEIHNNHVIANRTTTPRKEGLFGFNDQSEFAQISIRDNIIECKGLARPLFRKDASYRATVKNNHLVNVTDADRFENAAGPAGVGLDKPLRFACGVHGETTVDGWEVRPSDPGK